MINLLHSKLRSRRGSSLVFAMVAMAIAVMVSAVIIYAAENNIRRIKADRTAEQARLALNSAASVVRNEISGDQYSSTVHMTVVKETTDTVVTESGSTDSMVSVYEESRSGTEVVKLSSETGVNNCSSIENAVYEMTCAVLLKTNSDTYATIGSRVKKNFVISAENMPDVNVVLTMEPGALMDQTDDQKLEAEAEKYYITAVLSVEGYDAEQIRMTFMANDPTEHMTSTRIDHLSETLGTPPNTYVHEIDKFATVTTFSVKWPESGIIVNIIGN